MTDELNDRPRAKFMPNRFSWRLSLEKSRGLGREYKQVHSFCMFVGHPRSGHTLIGTLLNAHPEMVIANELDALAFINHGWYMRRQLFWLILARDEWFANRGFEWQGYRYVVPNQWQGKYRTLKVIGDKKAAKSTLWLQENPALLKKLQQRVRYPVKIIHVVRNPFDNIARMGLKAHKGKLKQATDLYFSLCETVEKVKETYPAERFLTMRHEDFIEQPQEMLRQACAFLGVEASQDYLDDCASLVFKSANKTRNQISWTPEMIATIEAQISRFDFLAGYSFTN